jgi:hypothetical protein
VPAYFSILPPACVLTDCDILIYAHGYKATVIYREPTFLRLIWGSRFDPEDKETLPKGLLTKGTIIELKPLKTAEEWAENIEMLEYIYLRPDENPEEKKFIEEDMEYGKRFKKAK